jgi:Domain of unknown function (DUF4276)
MFVTLRVLCEGPTEANFVTQVLAPHLKPYNVFAKPEPLQNESYGVVPYKRLYNAIKADIGRSRRHEYVTTMIDLYRIGDYPGADRVAGEDLLDRVRRIETRMGEILPNPRFIPYIQVHEFEALVFVDLDRLPEQFPDGEADGAPERLRLSVGNYGPEEINDGDETAPSKRIIREVPSYKPLKSIAGPAIALSIGLLHLRRACPHFNDWITGLEQLSGAE